MITNLSYSLIMVVNQDKYSVTYGFDFLQKTISNQASDLEQLDRQFFKSKKAEYYTDFRIGINQCDKEEIHSYFEKHYMNIIDFPSYSCCLKELILDFLNIPNDFDITRYDSSKGGRKTSIRVNTKNGDIHILKGLLLDYGDTFKDGIYTIFMNVKLYYGRDESKECVRSAFSAPLF